MLRYQCTTGSLKKFTAAGSKPPTKRARWRKSRQKLTLSSSGDGERLPDSDAAAVPGLRSNERTNCQKLKKRTYTILKAAGRR